MKKIFLSLLILTSIIGHPASIYALTAPAPTVSSGTSSAIPTFKVATPSATTDDSSLGDKIKSLVKDNLSATETDLTQKINQKTLVGYVGTIKSISAENISINSGDDPIQITTTNKTVFVSGSNTIKPSTLAIADKVIVIGTLIKKDIIQAKRIIVVTEDPNPVITTTLIAKVSSVDTKKKTIGLMINNQEVIYSLSKKTTIKIADIKVDQTLFAITKLYQGVSSLSRAKIL